MGGDQGHVYCGNKPERVFLGGAVDCYFAQGRVLCVIEG